MKAGEARLNGFEKLLGDPELDITGGTAAAAAMAPACKAASSRGPGEASSLFGGKRNVLSEISRGRPGRSISLTMLVCALRVDGRKLLLNDALSYDVSSALGVARSCSGVENWTKLLSAGGVCGALADGAEGLAELDEVASWCDASKAVVFCLGVALLGR